MYAIRSYYEERPAVREQRTHEPRLLHFVEVAHRGGGEPFQVERGRLAVLAVRADGQPDQEQAQQRAARHRAGSRQRVFGIGRQATDSSLLRVRVRPESATSLLTPAPRLIGLPFTPFAPFEKFIV